MPDRAVPLLDEPLRFEPFLRPMVWGGRRLQTHLGKPLPTEETYGEAWEVSDHQLHQSAVAEGPGRGRQLRELMGSDRSGLLGAAAERHAVFPWLIKFLDCHDWLSVQVHPDADVVRRLRPGEGSKTEAWFILHAEPGSRVYAGLRPGVGPAEMRAALAGGTVAELLHSFEPQAGDCVFLPAGTVHAVGGGVLMAEVQETSDVTFRLYDWDRVDARGQRRALHVEESFASINWDTGPVAPVRAGDPAAPESRSQALVRCPYFELSFHRANAPTPVGSGRLHALIVLDGAATWESGARLRRGDVWVLPAAMPARTVRPDGGVSFLVAALP